MTQLHEYSDPFDDDEDDEKLPSIAEFAGPWFAARVADATGLRRVRAARAAERYFECVEAEADRIATTTERAMLALEREADPHRAAVRALQVDAVPDTLRAYVSDRWLADDPQDRKMQLQLAGRLCREMLAVRPGDEQWSTCSLLDLQHELQAARATG